MKIKFKYFAIAVGTAITLYVGYRIFANLIFTGSFEKKYTRKEAIENYNNNEKAIIDLIDYFNSKIPANRDVTFGLSKKKNRFNIGVALPDGAVNRNLPNIGGNDLKPNSDKANSILATLSWTNETVDTLRDKLEKADCINIMGRNPVRIHYRYSGLGLHSYLIFDSPLTDSTIKMYNSELGDTVIRKNVVVLYTSSL